MHVNPLSRAEIDAWPIERSGLPVRVVNAVAAVPVKTIGQLRAVPESHLLKLKSLGRISLTHIRDFFKLCGQIEQGKQRFTTIKDVFSLVLDEAELNVLSTRYGLSREGYKVARNHSTLQQIADTLNVTRERIRQVQDAAVAQLGSYLAQTCLQPFYDLLAAEINNAGRVLGCQGLHAMPSVPAFGGWNVCSVALLLSDANPVRLAAYQGCFSTFPPADLRALEARLLEVLRQAAGPVGLEDLCRRAGPEIWADAARRPAVAACLLEHAPAAAATTDQRYFLFAGGAAPYLVEVVSRLERPVHFRKVTAAFNEGLLPVKRRGAGYILDLLGTHPRFTRIDRGVYDLKAG